MQRVLQSAWQAPRWRVCLSPTITATSSTKVNVRSCSSSAFLPHRLFGWCRPAPNFCTWKQILPVNSAFRPTVTAASSEHMHTNRLAKEESPYLLQHQHNPVRVKLNEFRYPVTCPGRVHSISAVLCIKTLAHSPGGLVSLVDRGLRQSHSRGQANFSVSRLLNVSLVRAVQASAGLCSILQQCPTTTHDTCNWTHSSLWL